MPKTAILYYSRTGTTKKVAETLGRALNAEVFRIGCRRYEGGWFRYLLAGYDSVKGRLPPIEIPDVSLEDLDLVILGSPIWTSYPALPLRSFLERKPQLPERVALLLTCGEHSPPRKAIDLVAELLPVPLEQTLTLSQDAVDADQFDDALNHFVDKFQ
ncbi:hypothetical protein K3148_03795 [Qipengyuania aurantiaca]|uniref:Flavodoxin-like domain-containing protein n=1 Tax=Qipengyuania aurantiaca TaxID=2867233 RepID=A0ABX8ZNE2_9SPHN|nr:hypothetical protein [Qipengyuania aurantiaca]QZD90525.1 hypothetical protein K3148_03795 [Qipengyuania aurantiaca]